MQEQLPDFLREFDDTKRTRQNIYSNTLDAMKARFPIEDDNYKLELIDPHYDGPTEFSLADQKKALLNNRNLRTNLVGTWRLTDKKTGQVLDERKDSVMQVPYWTDRGTFINNGSDYTVISQSRLRPGVYARRKSNGEYECQFNIKPGTGHAFHFGLNPETGVMTLQTGQGSLPLYQVLRGMGVSDKDIASYWGMEVLEANSKKNDPQAWNKLYKRLAGYKAVANATEADKVKFVREALSKYEVDPEVVERTMGLRDVSTVTPALMLRASQKLLNISRGDEKPDNRDSPRFSKFYGVEDYFKERIDKNAGRLANTLLYKARRNRNLKSIQRNALNPWVDTIINGSGLAMPGEEANPLSTLEQMSRITKFGLGGIGSSDAVTMEARDVQGDYLGFVDQNSGPECFPPDTMVMTGDGWVRFDEVTEDTEFLCWDFDKHEKRLSKPERIVCEDYSGDMIVFRVGYPTVIWNGDTRTEYPCELVVTPGHRLWLSSGRGQEFKFVKASEAITRLEAGEYFRMTSGSPEDTQPFLPEPLTGVSRRPYSGKVYCATVPGGLMFVAPPGCPAHWTGNSENVGVDVRAAYRTFLGKDNKLYAELINNKTGKKEFVDMSTAADRLVAFPGQDMNSPYVMAMKDGVPQQVRREEVGYTVPSYGHMITSNTNMNMMPTGVQSTRQFYGSKFWSQYLPQAHGEVPLVDSLMPDGKTTWSEYYGRKVGTLKSDVDGVVTKVDDNMVTIKGNDGKTYKKELVKNLQFNRLSLTGDTKVFVRRNGRPICMRLDEYSFKNGDEVQSYDPLTCRSAWMKVTGFTKHENRVRLYRVSFKSGRSVDCTENHSLLTMGDGFNLVPLYPKDCVLSQTKCPVVFSSAQTSDEWSFDQGLLDGLYISEGCAVRQSTGGVKKDRSVNKDGSLRKVRSNLKSAERVKTLCQIAVDPRDRQVFVRDLVERLGGHVHPSCMKERTSTRCSGKVVWTDRNLAARWVADFGEYANGKHIAGYVFSRGKDYLHGLLAGYLAGDGCLWSDTYGTVQVEFGTVSKELQHDLVSLCNMLGVFAMPRAAKFNGDGCQDIYFSRISTASLRVLNPLFGYPDRQAKLESLIAGKTVRATAFDNLPVETDSMKRQLYKSYPGKIPILIYKTVSSAKKVAKHRVSVCNGRVGLWANSDILWDTVTSIVEIPNQKYVYDFSVDRSEAFATANGTLVHNTAISFYPSVEVGQSVKAGDMIAHTNFTDKKTGAINMGQNLKVCIMADRGNSYEDAQVISESAAKRLATDRLYSFDHETRNGVTVGRDAYISAFPSKFTKDQIATLDEHGIAKVGTVLHRGDPLILSLGPKMLSSSDKALGKLSKALRNSYTDRSETWEHDYPGTVVDTAVTSKGVKVNVSAQPPVRRGDKLSGRSGLKGVVGAVRRDEDMPRDVVTNQPYDAIVNPMGFLSRVAPNQLMEISLAKIAKKTGKQIRIPQLPPPEGWYAWTKAQMEANGVPESSDVFDPISGKTIKNIGDGYMYTMAFHHLAEKKVSSRGSDGSYTQDEQPAKGGSEGAKKSSFMDLWAMLAHNVPEVIKDTQLVRGQLNQDYWQALQLGYPVPEPDVPFIYKKFLNTLRAGGVNVTEKGSITKIMPQTDKDVEALANGRVITSSEMVDQDFEPVKGGLFDLGKTGGMAGNQWSMIQLPEPVPNPVMEEPIRRVLGLTTSKLEGVLAGTEQLNGKTGGQAIKDALSKIDVDARIEESKRGITAYRGQKRDDAVKQYKYLTAMKEQGLKPQDWMISKVPVIPPVFRPVSKMGNVALVSDMNELYKDVIENVKNFEELRNDVDDSGLTDERLNIYNSVKAAYGLGQPITPENAAKGVKGALRQVMGSRPKFGLAQSKVFSKTVGGVARGVITPNPNLDIDQCGIPENMAWPMYKPYVLRELVRTGYPMTTAIKMVADRTDTARHVMEKVMSERPVILDRAPTWHKFNFMAFRPHLVDGNTIQVCPLTDAAFNADHDGDQMNAHVPSSDKAVKQALEKMLPSKNLTMLTTLSTPMYQPSKEQVFGLYALTKGVDNSKPVKFFNSVSEAKQAYARGEIGANDPIEIRGMT